jgi:hypothetical protein
MALSALEVHTIGKVQHIWTLCVLLELDVDDDFVMMMMLLLHHCIKSVIFFPLT